MTKDEALARIRASTEKLTNAETISEKDRDMILEVLLGILLLLTKSL